MEKHSPDNALQSLDLSEINVVQDLLFVFRKVYQHPETPQVTKGYIEFELRRLLKPSLDIAGFLRGEHD